MPTPSDPYLFRLTAVRQQFAQWGVEGLLIISPSNRRWLSGFTGSNAQLLITPEKALLATDFRYYERVATEAPAFTLFKHRRRDEDRQAFFAEAAVSKIGLEATHVTLAQMEQFATLPAIEWVPLDNTLEPLRQYKTAVEMKHHRQAAAITDLAMAQFNTIAQIGKTEKQLAWELEKIMRQNGADALAFPIIVASGPNSAFPHHENSDRPLQAGDTIIVDMGAEVAGYKSDMTRSFYLGNTPSAQFWEIYNLVLAAHKHVFDSFTPGMSVPAVDALARDLIRQAGYADNFGHGLGHGVGLDIHEAPHLSARTQPQETVEIGMNITVEPGVYLPGWGGIRIEDFVQVTETGLEMISQCPKTPIIPLKTD